MMHIVAAILVQGFVISAIFALGAVGFTLIFGVSGILNVAHGSVMIVAALLAWYLAGHTGMGPYLSSLIGIGASVVVSYLLFWLVIRPIEVSDKIPAADKEIFALTSTLLVATIIGGILNHFFGSDAVTTAPIVRGIQDILGIRVTNNALAIAAISWAALAGLWLFVTKTSTGRALMAASMSKMGLALVGYDIRSVDRILWGLYGLLAGIAGVMLASYLGANFDISNMLTADAFAIVVLGGMGSVVGSLVAAYIIGYADTLTTYVAGPIYTELPGLVILILVLYIRPRGLFGRQN